MLNMNKTMLYVVMAAAIVGVGQAAHATVITQGFESTSGYTLSHSGNASLAQSTDYAHSGSHSMKYHFPDDSAGSYAKTVQHVAPGQLQLGNTTGSFWSYIPQTSGNQDWLPYLYYQVDTNQNGVRDFGSTGDSFVIAFLGVNYNANNVDAGNWIQRTLDGSTSVHVVGNRAGLGSAFTTVGGPHGDTLGLLNGKSVGGGMTWGDLDILRFSVGTGTIDTSFASGYTVYVDDIKLSGVSVPAPSTMVLFVLGLGGLLLLSWRRQTQ